MQIPILIIVVLVFVALSIVVLVLFSRARGGRPQGKKAAPPTPAAPSQSIVQPPLSKPAPDVPQEIYGLKLITQDGKELNICSLPFTIGRTIQNGCVLQDPSVSSAHAKIDYDAFLQAVCIEDLESLNGLYVNAQPTHKSILQDNVLITLGNSTLIFRDTGYLPPSS